MKLLGHPIIRGTDELPLFKGLLVRTTRKSLGGIYRVRSAHRRGAYLQTLVTKTGKRSKSYTGHGCDLKHIIPIKEIPIDFPYQTKYKLGHFILYNRRIYEIKDYTYEGRSICLSVQEKEVNGEGVRFLALPDENTKTVKPYERAVEWKVDELEKEIQKWKNTIQKNELEILDERLIL